MRLLTYGDRLHISLAQIGRDLDVTRESIRQRKMRAFAALLLPS